MISSSKFETKRPIGTFSVLRPHPKILSLARSFKKATNDQNYSEAVDHDFGVRKYRVHVESF